MTYYSNNPRSVRVDFWKPSGKWYTTEAIEWTGGFDNVPIHKALAKSLRDHLTQPDNTIRLIDMRATCLEPCHEHSHPISILVNTI